MSNVVIDRELLEDVIEILQQEVNALAYLIDIAPLTEVVPHVKQKRMLQSCLDELIKVKTKQQPAAFDSLQDDFNGIM